MLTVWHILGWSTLASQAVGAGLIGRWLYVAQKESRTWMRHLPIPKSSAVPLSLTNGSDYVGLV